MDHFSYIRTYHNRNDELEARLRRLEERRDQELKVMVVLKRLLGSLGREIGKDLASLTDESLQRLLSGEADDRKRALEEAFQSIFENASILREGVAIHPLQHSEATESLDELGTYKVKCEELENWLADTRFDLQKSESKCDHLQNQLNKACEDLSRYSAAPPTLSISSPKPCKGGSSSDEVGNKLLCAYSIIIFHVVRMKPRKWSWLNTKSWLNQGWWRLKHFHKNWQKSGLNWKS